MTAAAYVPNSCHAYSNMHIVANVFVPPILRGKTKNPKSNPGFLLPANTRHVWTFRKDPLRDVDNIGELHKNNVFKTESAHPAAAANEYCLLHLIASTAVGWLWQPTRCVVSVRSIFSPSHATYTVNRKKTWHYIWHHNSGKTRSIFIISALL